MAVHYSYTPALDPGTGDWKAGRPGGQPATEAVLLLLRTQRGSYAPDPDYGVDFGLIQKRAPNTAALWQAEVRRALARLDRAGLVRDVAVTVDAPAASGRLFYSVEFTDPRTAERVPLRRLVA